MQVSTGAAATVLKMKAATREAALQSSSPRKRSKHAHKSLNEVEDGWLRRSRGLPPTYFRSDCSSTSAEIPCSKHAHHPQHTPELFAISSEGVSESAGPQPSELAGNALCPSLCISHLLMLCMMSCRNLCAIEADGEQPAYSTEDLDVLEEIVQEAEAALRKRQRSAADMSKKVCLALIFHYMYCNFTLRVHQIKPNTT